MQAAKDRSGKPGAAPILQRTLKTAIHCSGVCLHSGGRVQMTMHPAEPDTGIVFRRSDVAGRNAVIPASWRNVIDGARCTTLGNTEGVALIGVEHLLAALAGCGIDNLVVEVKGPELPVMDGSAWPFVFLAECAGIVQQEAPRRAIKVLKHVAVSADHKWASLTPGEGASVAVRIEYDDPTVSQQEYRLALVEGGFKAEISRARTYGFLHEVEELRAAGLARGASLENAIVVGNGVVLNEGGLRYPNEFARHKVLDALGDLYLAGAPILGHFHGHCSGHRLNYRVLRALFADADAWEQVTLAEGDLVATLPPVERKVVATA